MLGILRKYRDSIMIKGVFGLIVLSFIGTIFLVWGKGDGGSAGPAGFAAKVDGRKISTEEFQGAYERTRRIYQQLGGLTPEMEKSLRLKKTVLDNLIDNELIRSAAKKLGVVATADEVRKEIAQIPSFQKDGSFDRDVYLQVLRANRITPSDFEEQEKETILVRKTREKLQAEAQIGEEDLLKEFHRANDRVSLRYVKITPRDVEKDVKLTDADLNAYLQGHQSAFKAPEQLRIAYAVVDPSKAGAVAVSDEEITTYYQKNIDRYQGKDGILPLAAVKDRVKEDVRRNKAGKELYEKAADALNKNRTGADLAAIAGALGAKVTETPLFTKASPPPALAADPQVVERALMLKQGELGGPVETTRGVYVFKVMEKHPEAVPALAAIKGRVTAAATADKARELAGKKAEELQARLAKGDTTGIKLQETPAFGHKDQVIPGIGAAPALVDASFALTKTAPVAKAPVAVGEAWYAFLLKDRTEAPKEQFDRNKEELKKTLLPKKQEEALQKWLAEARKKAKIEINPALVAD